MKFFLCCRRDTYPRVPFWGKSPEASDEQLLRTGIRVVVELTPPCFGYAATLALNGSTEGEEVDSQTISHHTMHLVFLVDEDREVHADILWPLDRPFPQRETHLRIEPGTVVHVTDVVTNAFPDKEGSVGDLVIGGRLLADGTVMPMTVMGVEDLLTRKAVKHYRAGHYGN
jgi:hypothetical protein